MRSAGQIADTFLQPKDAAAFLASWGFEENDYRSFVAPSGVGPNPGAATSIEVSLHLFATRAGAANALPSYANGRAAALGLRVVGQDAIGDGAYLLQGPSPSGAGVEVTVYLLLGNVLARVSVVSPDGDPTADALAATIQVAAKA